MTWVIKMKSLSNANCIHEKTLYFVSCLSDSYIQQTSRVTEELQSDGAEHSEVMQ